MTTKFCINCKHCNDKHCLSPKAPSVLDLVSGKTYQKFRLCENNRKDLDGCCGPDAKHFEPKETV